MNKNSEKIVTLGGSVEMALSGKYELKINSVLQEGWKYTTRHFFSFLPAIMVLLTVWMGSFYIAFTLQLSDPIAVFELLNTQDPMSEAFFETVQNSGFIEAFFIAFFSSQVISSPIYAGISVMAMSHTAGLTTKPAHLFKGFSFTLPVITTIVIVLLLREVANRLLPFLGIYFSVAFSNAILLICERRLSPMQSLLLSFKAVNKKLLPIMAIHLILGAIIVMSLFYYGVFLIISLPFFFHVKGIIYRNMFGILLKVTTSNNDHGHDLNNEDKSGQDGSHTNKGSDIFDA